MTQKRSAAVSFLLLGLLGCHQDEPEAVVLAKQEHLHKKVFLTDQASLLYAQQELGLATAKAAAAQSAGSPVDERAQQAANDHLEQARLQLKLDADYIQLDEDLEKWNSFAQMLTRLQPPQGRR